MTQVAYDSLLKTLPVKIDGRWSGDDFLRFFSAMNAMYLYFLIASPTAEAVAASYRDRIRRSVGPIAARPRSNRDQQEEPTQEFLGFYSLDREIVKAIDEKTLELALVAEALHEAVKENEPLTLAGDVVVRSAAIGLLVSSVRYSSPGGINFQGLGEPLQQLREFIKDIAYGRNRAEAEQRDLENRRLRSETRLADLGVEEKQLDIVAKKAALLLDLGVSREVVAHAVLNQEHIRSIEALADEGKLTRVDNIRSD